MIMKKTLAILAVVVLICSFAIGSTFAYLQESTDVAKNVMTIGKVQIEQKEIFDNNQKLLPAVISGSLTVGDDGMWKDTCINNEIDKVISVYNKGTEAAFVRTVILFETVLSYVSGSSDKINADLHYLYIGTLGDFDYISYNYDDVAFSGQFVEIGGKVYAIAVCTYDEALTPGATTAPSLRQIFLAPSAGNEFYGFFGQDYEILALSQAVQAAGFDAADTALNEAFGAVTPENVLEWFADGTGNVISVTFEGNVEDFNWPEPEVPGNG